MKKELYRLLYQEDKLKRTQAMLQDETSRREAAEEEVVRLKNELIELKAEESSLLGDLEERQKKQESTMEELANKIKLKQKALADLRIDHESKTAELQQQHAEEQTAKVAAEKKLEELEMELNSVDSSQNSQATALRSEISATQEKTAQMNEYVQKRKLEFEALKREVELIMVARQNPDDHNSVAPQPPTASRGPSASKRRGSASQSTTRRSSSAASDQVKPAPASSNTMLNGTNVAFGEDIARSKESAGSGKSRSKKGR